MLSRHTRFFLATGKLPIRVIKRRRCTKKLFAAIQITHNASPGPDHYDGLLSYFDHRIDNGKAEGINNKIKVLKRQAYGFHDLEYFKLKLYHLHKKEYQLVG